MSRDPLSSPQPTHLGYRPLAGDPAEVEEYLYACSQGHLVQLPDDLPPWDYPSCETCGLQKEVERLRLALRDVVQGNRRTFPSVRELARAALQRPEVPND